MEQLPTLVEQEKILKTQMGNAFQQKNFNEIKRLLGELQTITKQKQALLAQ